MTAKYDAVIIGSGPNGLAAAITLARAGRKVLVIEGRDTIGGGTRTLELTLPGFRHDICSAVHPLGVGSPFFQSLPLEQFGLEWIQPPVAVAHPFEDGSAAILVKSVEETAARLGPDEKGYLRLFKPLSQDWARLASSLLGPLKWPAHPLALTRFGIYAIWPSDWIARFLFRGEAARALFAGMSAHSMLPLNQSPSAAFGLVLGMLGHAVGWPFPRGGSQQIARAMAGYLHSLGGEIVTGQWVNKLEELPPAQAVLLDSNPQQLLKIAGDHLPESYRKRLEKYRYGPGAFKIDYALSGPVPWTNPDCHQAGTLHLGGPLAEVSGGEIAVGKGQIPEKPFVLAAQQSLFDNTRAPAGQHTLWAYCHVPNGSTVDMTERIENQIERYAPGFRQLILARHVTTPQQFEEYNPNYIGGDINGGLQNWQQLFTRPVIKLDPYKTPAKNLFLCSASTPPGGGVHGMAGFFAAQAALHSLG